MTRKEEVRNASVTYNEKCGKFLVIGGDNILSEEEYLEFNKNPSFIAGAEWADNHPNLTWEDIRKICLIAENVHKYYGFWSQNVYEEIFNRFYKPEIWT